MINKINELSEKYYKKPASKQFIDFISSINTTKSHCDRIIIDIDVSLRQEESYQKLMNGLRSMFSKNVYDILSIQDKELILNGYVSINKNKIKISKFIVNELNNKDGENEDSDNSNSDTHFGIITKLSVLYSEVKTILNSTRLVISSKKEDLLFSSDICANWETCQSFNKNKYLSNILYACDEVTWIAYTINTSGNKTWRQMSYVMENGDRRAIYYSKQYPTKISSFTNQFIKNFNKFKLQGVPIETQLVIPLFDIRSNYGVVPFIDESEHIYTDVKLNGKSEFYTKFNYDIKIPCIICGKEDIKHKHGCDCELSSSGICAKCAKCASSIEIGDYIDMCAECGEKIEGIKQCVVIEKYKLHFGRCSRKHVFNCSECHTTQWNKNKANILGSTEIHQEICLSCYNKKLKPGRVKI